MAQLDLEHVAWGQFDPYRQAQIEAWNKQIATLKDWASDPSRLEDDGIEPPSRRVLARALEIATQLRDSGSRAFDRVVTTGDGGVAFHTDAGPDYYSVEVDGDGSAEFFHFRDRQLQSRSDIAPPFDVDG
jgi:hypothetical protein